MSRYEESRKFIDSSKLHGHGKTKVPSDIRKMFNLKDGDKLLWYIYNNLIVVERA